MPPPPPTVLTSLDSLRRRVEAIEARIETSRRASPFSADRVQLVIVTKSVPKAALALVTALGRKDIGENRVVDACDKRE